MLEQTWYDYLLYTELDPDISIICSRRKAFPLSDKNLKKIIYLHKNKEMWYDNDMHLPSSNDVDVSSYSVEFCSFDKLTFI